MDMAVGLERWTDTVEFKDIGHAYTARSGVARPVLDNINCRVGEGEFVCLLGPSGCGKTTLLNMIAGFITPSRGDIMVNRKKVKGPSPERGVVFQDYSLFPWLTVERNISFGLLMAGISRDKRREITARNLALVGLSEDAKRYPYELSGGMKQRVAIARALATNPSLLLMDEPFAALDAMTRGGLQTQLLDIQRQTGKTIIFVTHNIGEAIFLASRIIVMSAHPGRVAEDISLEDYPRPRRRSSPGFSALYERLAAAIGAEAGE